MKTKFKRVFSGILCIAAFSAQAAYAAAQKTPEDLRNADIEALVSQPVFDSREYGIITPVRDQGATSLCWAYSTASASEASILRKGIDSTVTANACFLSPQQIGYARHNRGKDPLGNTSGEITYQAGQWSNSDGGVSNAAGLLSTWCGPVAANLPYNVNGWENAAYKLESALWIDGSNLAQDAEARKKMKRAIVKYGAVTFSYSNARELELYNPVGENGGQPHACTVIGWDDTIPASDFRPNKARNNGGWLVKNSYNSLKYFYLSYDVTSGQIYAFDYAANDKYDHIYFYDEKAADLGVLPSMNIIRVASIFRAKKGTDKKIEQIKAVSVGITKETTECTVEIYTDIPEGTFDPQDTAPAASKTVYPEYGGFNCIELDSPVEIENGKNFAVAVTVKDGYIVLNESRGNSYKYSHGWYDLIQAPRIKAFTKTVDRPKNYVEFISESQVRAVAQSGLRRLVLACYESGVLKDIRIEPVDFDTAEEKILPLPDEWQRTQNTVYKAFLWDSTENPIPLCNAAEL